MLPLFLVSQLWLYLGNSQVSVYRTIGPLVTYAKDTGTDQVCGNRKAVVFATQIVQSLCFLNMKFQASIRLHWLYSPVCVIPGRKPPKTGFLGRCSNVKKRQYCCLMLLYDGEVIANSADLDQTACPLTSSLICVYTICSCICVRKHGTITAVI